MKVVIDGERCTGHGRCYAVSPTLFEADEEGRGILISTETPTGLRHEAQLAASSCPERAITVVE